MLHSTLSHLDSIDIRFLDPSASFVVMHQDVENELDQARLALDGLASIIECAAEMNIGAKHIKQLEVPPESLAALLRMLCNKVKSASCNPTLTAVQSLRPDLFKGD